MLKPSSDLVLRVFDQGLIALAGLILVGSAARMNGSESVGQLAVVTTVSLIIGGVFRLWVSEPALYVTRDDAGTTRIARAVGLLSMCALVLVAIVAALIGWWVAALATAVTGMAIWQETVRYTLVASRRSGISSLVSATYLAIVVVVAVIAPTVVWLLLGMTFALAVSALLGEWRLHVDLGGSEWHPRSLRLWWSIAGNYAAPGMVDAVFASLSMLLIPLILAARGSVSDLGFLRGGQTILGPLSVFMAGLSVWSIGWLAQRARPGDRHGQMIIAALGTAIVLLYAAVLWAFDAQVQRIILGPEMLVPAGILLVLTATQFLSAWNVGPIGALKLQGRYGKAVPLRALAGGSVLVLAIATPLGTTALGVALLLALQSAAFTATSVGVMLARK